MNTIINEVSQGRNFGAQAGNEVHWTFDWHQPVKPNAGSSNSNNPNNNIPSANSFLLGGNDHNGSRTNLNGSNSNLFQLENGRTENNVTQHHHGDDDTIERYPFKLKAWLKSQQSDYASLELEENNTLNELDLNLFDRTKISTNRDQTKIALEKNKRVDGDGLTEKDIRGAVAGSGSIPGLSASDNQNNAVEKKVPTEPTKQDISTPSVDKTNTTEQSATEATEQSATETNEQPIIETTPSSVASTKVSDITTLENDMNPAEDSMAEPTEVSIPPSLESSVNPSIEASKTTTEMPVASTTETPSSVDKEGDIEMEE